MNRKVCSDTAPLNRREWSVSECYRRGRKAGFVAGLLTQQRRQRRIAPILGELRNRNNPPIIPPQVALPPAQGIPNVINATKLKEVMGTNNYNVFLRQIRADGFRQETINQMGVKELRALATYMLNNGIKPNQQARLREALTERLPKADVKRLILQVLYS